MQRLLDAENQEQSVGTALPGEAPASARLGGLDAVRGLAALALEQQDFGEAYDLHRRLIELGEHSPELYYNAGLICQKRGQTEDAVGYYQQALQEDPQFAEALLNLGHALMAMGQEEEAKSFWRRAIREKPELAQTYFEPPMA